MEFWLVVFLACYARLQPCWSVYTHLKLPCLLWNSLIWLTIGLLDSVRVHTLCLLCKNYSWSTVCLAQIPDVFIFRRTNSLGNRYCLIHLETFAYSSLPNYKCDLTEMSEMISADAFLIIVSTLSRWTCQILTNCLSLSTQTSCIFNHVFLLNVLGLLRLFITVLRKRVLKCHHCPV